MDRDLPVAAALVALSATVALAFGRVLDGDAYVLPLLGAAVLPHAIAFVVRRRHWSALVGWAALIGGFAAYALLALAGASPSALVDRLRDGADVVGHRAIPLPGTPGVILLAAAIVWLCAMLADELVFRHRASLGALAPGALVLIWIAALGEEDGQWLTVGSFGIAAVLLLALQHQVLLRSRRTSLGERRAVDAPRLVAVALVTGLLAVGIGIAAAPALPGGDTPLLEPNGGAQDGEDQTYKTDVPPLLDVGDKLKQGDQVELFTVTADTADYWRITALDDYRSVSGGQWTLTAEGDDAVGEGLDEDVPDGALTQDYVIGQLGERWMPAAYRPVRIDRAETLVVRSSSTLVTTEESVSGLTYRVESALPTLDVSGAARERAGQEPPPELRDDELALPASFPESVRAEAARVTAGITSQFDKAQALRDYFRDGSFTYDTSVSTADDESAIEQFLLEKRGFCVQFASAYAVMARAVGLPARVAVGFTPGDLQQPGNVFHVTNWDAHAWPEVYLAGLGWTHMFDPTPPSDAPGGSSLPNEPQVGTPDTTTVTAPPATAPTPTTPDSSTPGTTPGTQPPVTVDPTGAPADDGSGVPWALLAILVIAAAVLVPAAGVLLLKARRRSRRRRDADPAQAITGAWNETLDELLDRRVTVGESETPRELARRVPTTTGAATARPLRSLADAYGEIRYGERTPSREDAQTAWRDVDALRDALDEGTDLRARLRARLDPSRFRRRVGARSGDES